MKAVTVKVHDMLPFPLLTRKVQYEANSCHVGLEPYTAHHVEMKISHSSPFCPDTLIIKCSCLHFLISHTSALSSFQLM